jgi:hypothetical protein
MIQGELNNGNCSYNVDKKMGQWTVMDTKTGALYGKIESVNDQGVTILLPDYYSINHPSVRVVDNNVKAKTEDVHALQRFFRRPFFSDDLFSFVDFSSHSHSSFHFSFNVKKVTRCLNRRGVANAST